jgi:EAL domain-containing protein (putative c-di-GMP-specific phosphodiesterase class I)
MPFNEMKIDKSLLMHMPESDEARIMVQALVNLAHNLGLTACAEGVESDEALGFLSQIECDFAQGFYICEPIPARSVASLIRESRFAIAQPRETEALQV